MATATEVVMPKPENENLDLDRWHQDLLLTSDVRTKSRDFYSGEAAVKAKKDTYLFRTANEGDTTYDFRLKRAVFDNWSALVVDSRQALLFGRPPDRAQLPAELVPYIYNVDGQGTHADVFFHRVILNAQIDGVSWVLVDSPNMVADPTDTDTPSGGNVITVQEPVSQLDEEQSGVRPYMISLRAEEVIDWEFGADRKLLWAVVVMDLAQKPGPGLPEVTEIRRLIWYRGQWELYALRKSEGNDKQQWVLIESGINGLGHVPLVPFYGFYVRPGLGWPVTRDVLGHNNAIYNKYSDRDYAEFLTNNPIPYTIGPEKPDVLDVSYGKGFHISTEKETGQAMVGYLEPTGNGIKASRESERDLIKRIFEISLRQAKRDTAQVQSQDTIREETYVFRSSLKAVSMMNSRQETECWVLFGGWISIVSPAEEVWTQHNADFNDKIVDEAFIRILSDMTDRNQLSRETFLNVLNNTQLLPLVLNVQEELERIERDGQSSAMPGFGEQQTEEEEVEDDGKEEVVEEEEEEETE